MTSFFCTIGRGAYCAAIEHHAAVSEALARRSEASLTPVPPAEEASACWWSGSDSFVRYGTDWHLLWAPLPGRIAAASPAGVLDELHAQMQGCTPDGVERKLARAQRAREDIAVWLAWSPGRGCVMAFRDPMGRVPLYVYACAGGWFVTNTRLALEPWLCAESLAGERVVASLLITGCPPTQRDAVFANLQRVPPGHCVRARAGARCEIQPWWTWKDPSLQPVDMRGAAERYRKVLTTAVSKLPTSGTIAIELSGGMDSTSLLAAFRGAHPAREMHALNFAAGDEDADRRLSQSLCAQLNVCWHGHGRPKGRDTAMPDPFTGGALDATTGLLAAMGERVHVLSGHGGDSLFRITPADMDRMVSGLGRRELWRCARAHHQIHGRWPPFFVRERLRGTAGGRPVLDFRLPWLQPSIAREAAAIYHANRQSAARSTGRQTMAEHVRWARIFEMGDPGFHGRSVYYHFPLFDLDVMRCVGQLPAAPFLYNKHLARAAFRGILPDAITHRPKSLYASRAQHIDPSEYPPDLWDHVPSWIDPGPLRAVLRAPQRFPAWSLGPSRMALDMLAWARARGREV